VWINRQAEGGVRPPAPRAQPSERELHLERALRLVRMALTREEHGVHNAVAVIDNALLTERK
jgi:hypothetical protein